MGDADGIGMSLRANPRHRRLNGAIQRNDYVEKIQNQLDILTNESSTLENQKQATVALRVLLRMKIPSIILPKVIDTLYLVFQREEQSEAITKNVMLIITNLGCHHSNVIHTMVKKGMIQFLIGVVKSNRREMLKDQAIWSLSNIAADCIKCRVAVVETGIIEDLILLLNNPNDPPTKRVICCWTLRNCFKFRNFTREIIQNKVGFLQGLKRCLMVEDESVPKEALCTLYQWLHYHRDSETLAILMSDSDLMDILIEFIDLPNDSKTNYSLLIFGKIVLSDHLEWTQGCLDYGLINVFERRFPIATNHIQMTMLWVASNVVAIRNINIIRQVCQHETFLELILKCCYDYDQSCRREALFIMLNAITIFGQMPLDENIGHFFPMLVVDVIGGFVEEDPKFSHVIEAYLTYLNEYYQKWGDFEEFTGRGKLTDAVNKRLKWCHKNEQASTKIKPGCLLLQKYLKNFTEERNTVYHDIFGLD